MSNVTRLDGWKREFPLRPGPLTFAECHHAMQLRAEWILQHPLHNAVSDWPPEERDYFDAVGRMIEASQPEEPDARPDHPLLADVLMMLDRLEHRSCGEGDRPACLVCFKQEPDHYPGCELAALIARVKAKANAQPVQYYRVSVWSRSVASTDRDHWRTHVSHTSNPQTVVDSLLRRGKPRDEILVEQRPGKGVKMPRPTAPGPQGLGVYGGGSKP